jgi:translation initiation factor 2 beta subunit (eIF-2beta)/eIF-5
MQIQDLINNLKPCKKCGSTRAKLMTRVAYDEYRYECKKCGYSPGVSKSMDEAIEKWNAQESG